MKVYKVYLNTKSSFLTYPKGDMIYGFFLYWWDKLGKDIKAIKDKIIFSDFLPNGYFKKPAFEFTKFSEDEDKRKEIKSKEWIKEDDLINGDLEKILEVKDDEFIKKRKVVKNHLNQIYLTTTENFAPYVIEEIEFMYPMVMYVGISDLDEKEIFKFLDEIGSFGFGKKSSIGKGVFEVSNYEDCTSIFQKKGSYYLSLSPFITTKKVKYGLFTRYGKFHGENAPFKNPIVLMDSGSVVLEECDISEGEIKKIKRGNKTYYFQAKSLMLPFKEKK